MLRRLIWSLFVALALCLPAFAASPQEQWKSIERDLASGRRGQARVALAKLSQEASGTEWEARALHALALMDYEEDKIQSALEKWKLVIVLPEIDPDTFFKALYNKSLCEYRAGSAEGALRTLMLIPEANLDTQSAPTKRAYYELGVLLASEAKKPEERAAFVSAARNKLSGADREAFAPPAQPAEPVAAPTVASGEAQLLLRSDTVTTRPWYVEPRLGAGYFTYDDAGSSIGGIALVVSAELVARLAKRWRAQADGALGFGGTPAHYFGAGGVVGYDLHSQLGLPFFISFGLGYETLSGSTDLRGLWGPRLRLDTRRDAWTAYLEGGPLSGATTSLAFTNYRFRLGLRRAWDLRGYSVGAGAEVIHISLNRAGAGAKATLPQLSASVSF